MVITQLRPCLLYACMLSQVVLLLVEVVLLIHTEPHMGSRDSETASARLADDYLANNPSEQHYALHSTHFKSSILGFPSDPGLFSRLWHNERFAEHIGFASGLHTTADTNRIQDIRIMCIIYTFSDDGVSKHRDLTKAVFQTWAQRCTGFMAASNETDARLGAIRIQHAGPETYRNMWQKVRSIWQYVHDQHINEYDFFYICGDDNFVVVENLRSYLASDELAEAAGAASYAELVSIPVLVGAHFRNTLKVIGTGGYAMNRAALRLFVSSMNTSTCMPTALSSAEDFRISECLRAHGAKFPVTKKDGHERFARFSPTMYYTEKITRRIGVACCSPELISLHYLQPWEIRWFYSRLYEQTARKDAWYTHD